MCQQSRSIVRIGLRRLQEPGGGIAARSLLVCLDPRSRCLLIRLRRQTRDIPSEAIYVIQDREERV